MSEIENDSEMNTNQSETANLKEDSEINQQNPNFPHRHFHGKYNPFLDPNSSFMDKVKFPITEGNNILKQLINSTSSSFDMIISHSDFPEIIKKILHTKKLLLIVFIINTHYLLINIHHNSILTLIYNVSFYVMLIFYFLFYLLNYFNQHLYLEKDEEIEAFVLKRNPLLEENRCEVCQTIKCMRSVHCEFCNKCVIKYNFHSDWFNICIGGSNELIYGFTLFIMIFYFIVCFFFIVYDNFVNSEANDFLLQTQIWMIVMLYIIIDTLIFYKRLIKGFCKNVTFYEASHQNYISYLFKDYSKEYFNPFDKGWKKNLEEIFSNSFCFIKKQKKEEKEEENKVEISEDNTNINQPNHRQYYYGQLESLKLYVELNKPFKEFISSQGNIHQKVNGQNYINWSILRIYNIFDIENCPFKNIIYQQAVNTLKKYGYIIKNENKQEDNDK